MPELRMINGHPWCPVCKKFTKKDGSHTCDPNWRDRLKAARTSGGGAAGTRKRRWRLTPKRLAKIKTLAAWAAAYKCCGKAAKKLTERKGKRDSIDKKARKLVKSLGL